MPQGNPYQNGQPGMPQGNPYQNGQPGGPQGNPYQNGSGQGPQSTGEPANSRKEAWDAQYRQNHWSNQAENQSQGNLHPSMQPGIPQENPYQNGQPGAPQGNPYQNGRPGMPQGNPYQNGMLGGMPKPVNRQAEPAGQWETAGPDDGGKPAEPENSGSRGAFSGALQESIEKSQDPNFVPYESPEKQEEAAGQETGSEPQGRTETPEAVLQKEISGSAIVDNEQDAEIVLEAAAKALEQEENKRTDAEDFAEETTAEVSDDTEKENEE